MTLDRDPRPTSDAAGPLHAFLAGTGADGRGRTLQSVLAQSDDWLESVHDYVQWLFPLATRSGAQPAAPVLTAAEDEAIRRDGRACANLDRAAERMLAFYRASRPWLDPYDHNHLRITRIIASLHRLLGAERARAFHHAVLEIATQRGAAVNPASLAYWERAAAGRGD